MPAILVPSIRVVPKTAREWDLLFRSIRVEPDDNSTGTAAIEDDAVTNAKLRNSGAFSVIGRNASTAGDPADISATVVNTFLVFRTGVLGFGPLVDADIPSTIARDTEVATAISDHEAATDPHPTYTTASEVTTAVSGAITTHEGAVDPHPGYLTETEADALYQPISTALGMLYTGTGDPENNVTAPQGSLFLRTDGGAGSTLYVKESGAGDTGWVGK